jgi:hypothetical protein
MKRFQILAISLGIATVFGASSLMQSSFAFNTWRIIGPAVHEGLDHQVIDQRGFSQSAFKLIDKGNSNQDILGSTAFNTPSHHFDDCSFSDSVGHLNTVKGNIQNLLSQAASSADARKQIYLLFGEQLHAVQDFYSHSNFVELQLAKNPATVNPQDMQLADWSQVANGQSFVGPIRTGYFYLLENQVPRGTSISKLSAQFPAAHFKAVDDYCAFITCGVTGAKWYISYDTAIANATSNFDELHYYLNKDDEKMPEGFVKLSNGTSLHSVARDLAARETVRQWDDLEQAINQAQPANAAQIIQALKTNTNQP